jgi:hypothetical protein
MTTQMTCIQQQSCDFCVDILITTFVFQRRHPRRNQPAPLSNGVISLTSMARGSMALTKHKQKSASANQRGHDSTFIPFYSGAFIVITICSFHLGSQWHSHA